MSIKSKYNRFDDWASGLPAAQYALLVGFSTLAITIPLAVAFAAATGINAGSLIVSMVGAAIGVMIAFYLVGNRQNG